MKDDGSRWRGITCPGLTRRIAVPKDYCLSLLQSTGYVKLQAASKTGEGASGGNYARSPLQSSFLEIWQNVIRRVRIL